MQQREPDGLKREKLVWDSEVLLRRREHSAHTPERHRRLMNECAEEEIISSIMVEETSRTRAVASRSNAARVRLLRDAEVSP